MSYRSVCYRLYENHLLIEHPVLEELTLDFMLVTAKSQSLIILYCDLLRVFFPLFRAFGFP